MTAKTSVLLLAPMPDNMRSKLTADFDGCDFVDGRQPADLDRHLGGAAVTYGVPPAARLNEAANLRWIQLTSAGVPLDLPPAARGRDLLVTNLAGLYGTTIPEHALALMLVLARNLHTAWGNQQRQCWDHDVYHEMSDLHGRTVAVIGLGSIGRGIARLARAFGMRVLGCRRSDRPTPFVDQLYTLGEMHALLAEADYVVVAAPLTPLTEGLLGPAEFAAMKRGVVYVNVSRGAIAQEAALLTALQSGYVGAAGLDVFAAEPLPADHPLWRMPQVVISPHYSGETANYSALPARRFARNLRSWLLGRPLEGVVNLEQGY